MQPNLQPGRHRAARAHARTAVTLVELVVVVAILTAIAGLLTAHMPGLLDRAGSAVAGASLEGLAQAMERHRILHGRYPDGYDSLLQAPYTLYAAVPAASLRQLKPKDLDNPDRRVLNEYGITSSWMHGAPDGSAATWQPLTTTKALDVKATGYAADDVAALDTNRISPDALFGTGTRKGTPQEVFVVFGIGSRCSLVGHGRELAEAPVGPRSGRALDPRTRYTRLGVVFRLDRQDPKPVRLCGAVAFTDTGILTASDSVRRWHARR